MSFLQARDPSLLAWNVHDLDKVRKDLRNGLFEDTDVSEPESEPEKVCQGIKWDLFNLIMYFVIF